MYPTIIGMVFVSLWSQILRHTASLEKTHFRFDLLERRFRAKRSAQGDAMVSIARKTELAGL